MEFERSNKLQRQVRQLQAVEQCVATTSLNTTYNDVAEVPPYTGIMFEIFARTNIEILTFEMDLRMENATDLSVEIYSLEGPFALLVNNASAWELVAKTVAIPEPGGNGVIVPVGDFSPVKMAERTKRSFYVTMKGPYLDHRVNALQKTGEVQISMPDIEIFVGAGLTEYKFPGKIDRLVQPQFAGVIHYTKTADCNKIVSTTLVEYKLLLDRVDLFLEANAAIAAAIDKLMQSNEVLNGYVEEFKLQIAQPAVTEKQAFSSTYLCRIRFGDEENGVDLH